MLAFAHFEFLELLRRKIASYSHKLSNASPTFPKTSEIESAARTFEELENA